MVCSAPRMFLGILMAFNVVYLSDSASPDLGAPDSNNLNMEFTPDDAVAGGVDTSLDNNNATPLIITTFAATTTRTTTSTTTTTTTPAKSLTKSTRLTPSVASTLRVPTTTTTPATTKTRVTTLQSKTTFTATEPLPWVDPTNSDSGSGYKPYTDPRQSLNSGGVPNQNGRQFGPHDSQYTQGQTSQGQQPQGNHHLRQSPRGSHYLPWWWLLVEEV